MRRKILTVLFALLIVIPHIYAPAYAEIVQDNALFSAAQKGDVDEVKRLLTADVKINAESRAGEQAIHYATQFGNIEVVKALLAAGAKVDAVDKSGYQPIHYAAQKGYIEIVKVLLAAGAKVDARVEALNKFGGQPIHFAAQSGNAELIKILLAAGVNANAQDNSGKSPLQWISNRGNPELVKQMLLAAGAKKVPTDWEEWKAGLKPKWLEINEPQIRLGLWDQNNTKENFNAKYIVKCETGASYVAEKAVTSSNPESSVVIFPKDFHYAMKELESHHANDCGDGKHGTKFTWFIYADDVLIDSGTITSTRKKHH